MVMILFIYGGQLLGLPKTDIITMIGLLVTKNKQAAVTIGGAIHFTMGITFAIIYALLWSVGIGRAIWWGGLLFGTIHGMLVVLLLVLGMLVYPRLQEVIGGPLMIASVLFNHIVFGLVVAIVYTA
jgi:hypothetical protein